MGVESLDEILFRRDLVDIKKQNIAVYLAKKAYTPKFAFAIMLAVVLMVSAILYEKFDDNPTFKKIRTKTTKRHPIHKIFPRELAKSS